MNTNKNIQEQVLAHIKNTLKKDIKKYKSKVKDDAEELSYESGLLMYAQVTLSRIERHEELLTRFERIENSLKEGKNGTRNQKEN